jgi:DNA-binding response OmpR family regulator
MNARKHAVELVVVDDAPEAARALADLLETDGYNVRVADSGLDALRLVDEKLPLAVLLDVDMPGMSGDQLAHRLREEHRGELVLVAFTGLGDHSAAVMKTLPLVDHFLRKPVDPKQLRKLFPRLAHDEAH